MEIEKTQLPVQGVPGQIYVLKASTKLINWDTIRFDMLDAPEFDFLDVDAPQYSQRFYFVLPLHAVLDGPAPP
ncbi:MAG TPA: hypothetical protein VFR12_06120 [Pyrinomonadaceae bacterium]|nr:hypothetical protein [Pyrinomonadaceae bacterium]